MGLVEGKVAIVTGGAKGIGSASAWEFAREGASVSVADIDEEAGRRLEADMRSQGFRALFIPADVSRAEDCRRVVEETVRAFGGVDILFNNVGIQPLDSYRRIEDYTEEMWDRILDVNLKSFFLMTKFAIPEMRKRGGGVIINTASVQGLQSQPLVPAYAASKGGILSLTRQVALDYARENIRVLAVCPGAIDTPLLRAVAEQEARARGKTVDEVVQEWGKTHPIGRIGTPQDIANVVVFLASDRASFMTGEYVCVDGGYMALGAWASTTTPEG